MERWSVPTGEEIQKLIQGLGLVQRRSVLQKAGGVLPVHIDVKGSFANPQQLRMLAAGLDSMIDPMTTCVAASGYGGIPLATAIALERGHRLTLVREHVKPYGARLTIEGHLPLPTDVVAIVDDKIVSGLTMTHTAATLAATAAKVVGMYVVLDARVVNDDPLVHSLTTLEAFLT